MLNVVLNGKKADDATAMVILKKCIAGIYSSTYKRKGITYVPEKIRMDIDFGDMDDLNTFIIRDYRVNMSIENNVVDVKLDTYSVVRLDAPARSITDSIEFNETFDELDGHLKDMFKYIFDIE